MQEGGAHMVKLEGGASLVPTVRLLARHGVPVCAHLGLLPQSVLRLGGYRYQGRDESSAEQMLRDAVALQEAGAGMLVLECVPAALAREISLSLTIPVIGIGAGNGCDGQVLVLYDMLGLNPHKPPGFSKDFLADRSGVADAVAAYVQAVKAGAFPAPEHTKL
jgi:3-methyl-2-oxobutanoate hydroxymethyltransferase